MKKLIVMMAIAMTAAVVNAAAATWGIGGSATASVKNGSAVWSAAGTNPVAYLFLASDSAAVTAALQNGAMDTTLAKATETTFNARGRFSGTAIDLPETADSYSMVLVYTDATDANKIWYQIANATVTAAGSDDPAVVAQNANFAATNFSSTGWSSATASTGDVPEPTSGLLLLVGAAGLALRRRRA